MDVLFWWVGAIVVGAVALFVAYCVLIEFAIVGLANALSFRRWRISCLKIEKKHDPSLQVWRFSLNLWWLFRAAINFTGHRNNGDTTWSWHNTNSFGEWRGIGDHSHVERQTLSVTTKAELSK